MAAGTLNRDAIPGRDEYARRFGITFRGRGTNVMGPCGICGSSDACSFHTDGRWHCFSCEASGGDMLDFHRQVNGLTLADAARDLGAWLEGDRSAPRNTPAKAISRPVTAREREPLSEYARALLRGSEPLRDTIGAKYLTGRRCPLPPADGDLRFHPRVWHSPTGTYWPALIGAIGDVKTRETIGVHRTFLAADGTGKAPVQPARMVLGNKQGGVIRLWPDEAVTYGLAVAEGIETALSLAHACTPAWACIDAGNLAALPVLAGIETLLIAADNDPPGIKGANECATRWACAGIEVLVTQQAANDVNDALQGVA